VGVGAEDDAGAAVEVPAEGDFFAGGFGVYVDDDDFDVARDLLDDAIDGLERAIDDGPHEEPAHERDNGDARPALGLVGSIFAANGGGREVGRPDDAVGAGENGDDFAAAIDVVAHGHEVDAVAAEFFVERGGEAGAAGDVFDVGDDAVDGVIADDGGQGVAEDEAAGAADDVADAEDVDVHARVLSAAGCEASGLGTVRERRAV
jgi:hypothetical protein